jgi:hypothetical protein
MIYLTVTIDTEPDCSLSWRYSNPLTFRGISEGINVRLQPLFNQYGIVPTYLLNNVVLEDEDSVNILRNLQGKFELGTHLHPEFIEPQKSVHDYNGAVGAAHCCFYDAAIEYGKLENITALFADRFGYSPTVFRAGRFSAGENTFGALNKLGYKIDTSATPHVIWDNSPGDMTYPQPVDYRATPEQPYFIDGLLEAPVSIMVKRDLRRAVREFLFSVGGLLRRPRYSRKIWLRPVYSSIDEMKLLFEYYTNKYQHQENISLNMMFHNVEVMPSCSPYTKTEDDCARYLDTLARFFRFCNEHGVISVKLSELYEKFK